MGNETDESNETADAPPDGEPAGDGADDQEPEPANDLDNEPADGGGDQDDSNETNTTEPPTAPTDKFLVIRVLNQDGEPVKGEPVTATYEDESTAERETDADGEVPDPAIHHTSRGAWIRAC